MKLSEKINIVVMFLISILLGYFMGGCTDKETEWVSKQSDCLSKATLCHVATFDRQTEICTERDIDEWEPCNTKDPCIYSCQCLKNEPKKVMLPQIDDGNQCTVDGCTIRSALNYKYLEDKQKYFIAHITHEDMLEGQRCGPAGISDGQCRQGLCVMPGGSIHIEHPIMFDSPAE